MELIYSFCIVAPFFFILQTNGGIQAASGTVVFSCIHAIFMHLFQVWMYQQYRIVIFLCELTLK